MARIYLGLAVVSFLLLLTNLALGLWTGPYGEAADQMIQAGRHVDELSKEVERAQFRLRRGGENQAADQAALDEAQAKLEQARADHRQATREFDALRPRVNVHMLLGIAASLVAILVNSIAVTYFVGTSRWCREVVETYRLDPALAEESQRLKRRTFPWSLAGMLTIVVLVGLGASSDPGANLSSHLQWRGWHFGFAVLATVFLGIAFLQQMQNVGANYRVIERILAEVRRIRQERGLEVDEVAGTPS